MLTLLSPAKALNLEPVETPLEITSPALKSETRALAKIAKQQSTADLKRLMHISDNLAELNADRYKAFNLNGQSNSAKPAALTFNGDVYGGLSAGTLSDEDMKFAQEHLRILSGLYGVLRPMDAIQPYRLEMGTKLENPNGANLYKYWGSKISEQLNSNLNGHSGQAIMNLASNEYFKAVDKKALSVPVIEAKFLNVKDGNARNLGFFAKRARGLMARWMMQNRIDNPAELGRFNLEGYKLRKSDSTDSLLVFSRKQPPPPGKTK